MFCPGYGAICLCIYQIIRIYQVSGECLQDHWLSSFNCVLLFSLLFLLIYASIKTAFLLRNSHCIYSVSCVIKHVCIVVSDDLKTLTGNFVVLT